MDPTRACLPGPGRGRSDVPLRSRPARRGSVLLVGVILSLAASTGAATARRIAPTAVDEQSARSTAVTFRGCSELASIATISPAQARTVVPASFVLAGDSSGTPFVVRVADCDAVTVDGDSREPATVAQLGVSVESPDRSGDINNYTLWYYTDSRRLAARLQQVGVPAQWIPQLRYDLAETPDRTGGTLTIDLSTGRPAFTVIARITEPAGTPTPFVANWWRRSDQRLTKMSTPIPALRFGVATATLRTPGAGPLGRLLGSGTATFPLLDTFNRFADATMTVIRSDQ